MRRLASLLLLTSFLMVGACSSSPMVLPTETVRIEMGGRSFAVTAEVATTSQDRATGLMGRNTVPDGTGMLFVYPAPGSWGGIWMKNTLVALDVAFIRDTQILEIHTLQSCRADPCPVTTPEEEYDLVLEVAAGTFARERVAAGATVRRSR